LITLSIWEEVRRWILEVDLGLCAREKPEVVGVEHERDGETQRKDGTANIIIRLLSVNRVFSDDRKYLIHCAYQLRLFAIMINSILTCNKAPKKDYRPGLM